MSWNGLIKTGQCSEFAWDWTRTLPLHGESGCGHETGTDRTFWRWDSFKKAWPGPVLPHDGECLASESTSPPSGYLQNSKDMDLHVIGQKQLLRICKPEQKLR